ncbi:MAPEG family protein [Maricaulaceae bacterium MS644]
MHPILAPIFVQVLVFFALVVIMGAARFKALGAGAVKPGDVDLGQKAWPAKTQQISNALNNQFETPVYFFAAAILAIVLQVQDAVMLGAAWLYVVTRVVHALIYSTSNAVGLRIPVFSLGAICILVMWVRLAVFAFSGGQAG